MIAAPQIVGSSAGSGLNPAMALPATKHYRAQPPTPAAGEREVRTRFKQAIGVCGVLGMVAIGLSTTGAAAAAARPASPTDYERTLATYARQKLVWHECFPGEGLPFFTCALMTAPKDWSHPKAGNIQVLISRIRASDQARRHGILEGNFGGPGGPSVTFPLFIHDLEPDVAAVFDSIGIDPRGVGGSTNLDCTSPDLLTELYQLDGRDFSRANTRRFLTLSKRFARRCAADPLTPFITTEQTVRDLDLVRAVLGEVKTSYVGFSAGTWLGAWYATRFPDRVDRFVLDGNTQFTTNWFDSFSTQPEAFQRSFETVLEPWLARYDDHFHLGTSAAAVNRTYEQRRAKLVAHPITFPDGSRLLASGYDFGIGSALYSTAEYPGLGEAMSILEHYDTASVDQRQIVESWFGSFTSGASDNTFNAIVCQDTAKPTPAEVKSEWLRFRERYPLTGASWLADPCPYWPIRPTGSPVTGKGIPPLLMINNDGDPATPYSGARRAHEATPNSILLTVRHESDHTIYGAGDTCVENIANRWLLNGILPSHDRVCEGIPLPVLAPASAPTAVVATSGSTALAWDRAFRAAHGQPPQTLLAGGR